MFLSNIKLQKSTFNDKVFLTLKNFFTDFQYVKHLVLTEVNKNLEIVFGCRKKVLVTENEQKPFT